MLVTTSTLFDFLESRQAIIVERYEFASASFSSLRRSLRQIASELDDSEGEAEELSDAIRKVLCEWLTAPVAFTAMRDAMSRLFGAPEHIGTHWGSNVKRLHVASLQTADDLSACVNPMREKLTESIRQLRLHAQSFRIFCHRHARAHFESLITSCTDSPLGEGTFLHSVRDYREAGLFDALLKVGPLRSSGWGSAPDAIVTAPRFGTLIQFVWSGCGDEPSFGYDPAVSSSSSDGAPAEIFGAVRDGAPKWTRRVTRLGDDPEALNGNEADVDELQVFSDLKRERDNRPATLVQIDAQRGILYPPHSQVLSFDLDPLACEPFERRIPAETLMEGMYLIRPAVDDIDLGPMRAEHGRYSRIWKERLAQRWRADPLEGLNLFLRLQAAGLDLENLPAAIEHWCKPPTTVIHAPKRIKHFEILLQAIGLGGEQENGIDPRRTPFWRLAWNEVRHSRGEAIQAGFQENEIIEKELVALLTKQLPEIRLKAAEHAQFTLPIPLTSGIKGVLQFFPVHRIEEGFRVSDTDLKTVLPLTAIEQWRG